MIIAIPGCSWLRNPDGATHDAEGSEVSDDLHWALQSVAALGGEVASAVTASAGKEREWKAQAEIVTLVVKGAVMLRKAVPDAGEFRGSVEEGAAIAAALEAAGEVLAAAGHLKSSAGAPFECLFHHLSI